MSLRHLSTNEIRNIVSVPVVKMSDHDRDEMAIPSYLHGNPLVRWLMWKRYEIIAKLSKIESGDTVLEFGWSGLFLPTLADGGLKMSLPWISSRNMLMKPLRSLI